MALGKAVLGSVAVVAIVVAVGLYRDNRRLAAELARAKPVTATDPGSSPSVTPAAGDASSAADSVTASRWPWQRLPRLGGGPGAAPAAAEAVPESRLDRRLRRQRALTDLLGRDPDESDEAYRARILPFMEMALEKPRQNVDEMRKNAEAAAQVTRDQSQKLDAAFDEVYSELLDYTNGAISDGQLSPYERNVKGILQYAGGLGAILEGAEGRVGKILSTEQVKALSATGFEWGEYLGVRAPWESLRPPPPRPPGS